MPAITTDGLRKTYGDTAALDGLSFSVEGGELYGLLGPNGAGKTTAIEVLTGQTAPDEGTASVLGKDPVRAPTAVREAAGILPETESPPSFLTPREYLDFVGAVRKQADGRVDEKIATWASDLGYEGKLDTLATDLSRGEQQKVMITAAFLHEPDVVFIDEPLVNLDPLIQEQMKRLLTGYGDQGNAILFSTHNVDVASEICSRVGILYGGDLVAEVAPDELDEDESLLDVFVDRVDAAALEDEDLSGDWEEVDLA
jgi:ABC-2 type transport system ATP-binding protein